MLITDGVYNITYHFRFVTHGLAALLVIIQSNKFQYGHAVINLEQSHIFLTY